MTLKIKWEIQNNSFGFDFCDTIVELCPLTCASHFKTTFLLSTF